MHVPPLHYPTYNYCGPLTWDFSKKPKNRLDRACRRHDIAYDKYHRRGKRYYTQANNADDKFLREIRRIRGPAAGFARSLFMAKKRTLKRMIEPPVSDTHNIIRRRFNPALPSNVVPGSIPTKTISAHKDIGMVRSNTNYSRAVTKKRGRRPRRKARVSRSLRKKINSVVKKDTCTAPLNTHVRGFVIMNVPKNVVTYSQVWASTISNYDYYYANNMKILGNTDAGVTRVETINPATVTGESVKSMYIKFSRMYSFKNDTNFGCTLSFYVVKALTDTLIAPSQEWNNMYQAKFGDTTLPVGDDYFAYPETIGSKAYKRQWKIISRRDINSQGGQEHSINLSIPYFKYQKFKYDDLDYADQMFLKGSYCIIVRKVGKLSTEETAAGVAPTMAGLGNCDLAAAFRQVVTTKFERKLDAKPNTMSTLTSSVLTTPWQADQFAPAVGKYV